MNSKLKRKMWALIISTLIIIVSSLPIGLILKHGYNIDYSYFVGVFFIVLFVLIDLLLAKIVSK
jgi:hypothetical protein